MRTVRSLVRTLIAVLLALAGSALVFPAVHAAAQEVHDQSYRTSAAVSQALTISIDGMSPRYASPGKTVTVRGTLTNHTGSAISGLSVTPETSRTDLFSQADMTSFAAGSSTDQLGPAGAASAVPGSLAGGATVQWSVTFTPAIYYAATQIEVYPVAVLASSATSSYQASSRTFLPYWPSKNAGNPLQVAWVMPLIDAPQQGACAQTLATDTLASSVAPGGRLDTLLETGRQWSQRDDLTWAIDPALVSDVSVMTKPYFSGGKATCTGRSRQPASPAAQSWLTDLAAGTAGQSAFATPYADVDVSALSHTGLDSDVQSAYQLGNTVAARLLPKTFGPSAVGSDPARADAWPADGIADSGVLTSLASAGSVKTVVLTSSEFPPEPSPTAVYRTATGTGGSMALLLANDQLTTLLGSATASSSGSSQFAVTQGFLAQTAVILAAEPYSDRSLVIAPPRDWDPSAAELKTLLEMTRNAKWLHAVGLPKLATESAGAPTLSVPSHVRSDRELTNAYLGQVQGLDASLTLFENLFYKPSSALLDVFNEAYAVTQSSAWRGRGSEGPGGWQPKVQLASYLNVAERTVQLIASKKLLLTGTSARTAVSVRNGLDTIGLRVTIQVTVQDLTEPGSPLRVGDFNRTLNVLVGQTQTAWLPIHSSTIGTSTMRLQLATSNGSPLTWTTQPLSVEVTRFGRSLLVIIGGALAILVLTSIYRLHRKRLATARHGDSAGSDSAGDTPEAGGAG
jgi:hypothetical protein